MSVKRYSVYLPHYETGEIEEIPDGEYVQYADYAALAERCERLEAICRRLARKSMPHSTYLSTVYTSDIAAIDAELALSGSSGGKDGR